MRYSERWRRIRASLLNPRPTLRQRLIVAICAAVLCGAFFSGGSSSPEYGSDLDQVWYASRALLGGQDPYSVVGPGQPYDKGFPLYYPLPALMVFVPLALLPLALARLVFVAGTAALLAYAVTARGWRLLVLFGSGAYLAALAAVQWSPLLTAAFLLPWLGPVLVLKPNIGLALFLASSDRRLISWCVLGGGVLLLGSLFLMPDWPQRWLTLVRSAPHFTPPLLQPAGFLILLAAMKWRRQEARLLLAMACIPHTTLVYEALPLLLIARNWKETILLSALTFAALAFQFSVDVRIAADDPGALAAFTEWVQSVGSCMVLLVYVPATAMVLLRRNEGPPPAFLQWPLTALQRKTWRRDPGLD